MSGAEERFETPPFDWSVFDGVRCVFWICGDHESESVTWDRTVYGIGEILRRFRDLTSGDEIAVIKFREGGTKNVKLMWTRLEGAF